MGEDFIKVNGVKIRFDWAVDEDWNGSRFTGFTGRVWRLKRGGYIDVLFEAKGTSFTQVDNQVHDFIKEHRV